MLDGAVIVSPKPSLVAGPLRDEKQSQGIFSSVKTVAAVGAG